jgi:sulfhydrogenase subunit beta (sulfur reductase)
MFILEPGALQDLITVLQSKGFMVVGPTVRDGSITLETITSTDELPRGWSDVQEPSHYSIVRRNDGALFAYNVGPHSWKKFLFPPRLRLFAARRAGKGFEVDTPEESIPTRYAFLGVRPCELHAIALQDKVFMTGQFADQRYSAFRAQAFFIAVNCVRAGGTCFCASMNTGPSAREGYDLALTEVIADGTHHFVLEVGSKAGQTIVKEIPHREAEQGEVERARALCRDAGEHMFRSLETRDLPGMLAESFEHPQWDDVSKRCLACANCTMVCPTCFCSTVEDVTDLSGEHAERWRRWDSCFTSDFTKVAGGNIRMSTRTRYRQWLTHKLSNWVEQFGTMGCVGCGRCITWCPSGIDITAEAAAIRETGSTSTLG